MGQLKEVTQVQEFFLDKEPQVSSSGGLLRGFYYRKVTAHSVDPRLIVWTDAKGNILNDYNGYDKKLEEMYQLGK